MEPFVDFGLLEVLFVLGLTYTAVKFYSRKTPRLLIMSLGVLGAIILFIFSTNFVLKAVALLCILITIVNSYVIFIISQNHNITESLQKSQVKLTGKAKKFVRSVTFRDIKG